MPSATPTYGLILSNRGVVLGTDTPKGLIDIACRAEATGRFDTVWAGDAFLTNPRLDCVPLLAAVAARTERVRLGPACMGSFPLRDPLMLAYEWASLDRISGGRTVMVACVGGGAGEAWVREAAATGIPPSERRRRMWEGIEALRTLWSDGQGGFSGEFRRFEGVDVQPKPARSPLPIWVASNPSGSAAGRAMGDSARKALRRVGRVADGWMTHSIEPDAFAACWQVIVERAAELGRDPDRLENAFYLNVRIERERDTALEGAKHYLDAYYQADFTSERVRRWTAAGPAADVAAELAAWRGSGAGHLALRLAGDDQEEQFRRLTRDVLPRLDG